MYLSLLFLFLPQVALWVLERNVDVPPPLARQWPTQNSPIPLIYIDLIQPISTIQVVRSSMSTSISRSVGIAVVVVRPMHSLHVWVNGIATEYSHAAPANVCPTPARHAIAPSQLLDRHATLRALFYPSALFSDPRIDKTFLLSSGIPSSSTVDTRHPLVRVLVTAIAYRSGTRRTVQRLGSPISLADSSAIDLCTVRSLAVLELLSVFGNICVKRSF